MAVNLLPPDPEALHAVAGVELGIAMAGVRNRDRKDLLVLSVTQGARVAGVFTRNRFCAAPVVLAKRHLDAGRGIRALVVNTGNANAGTGDDGLARAATVCAALARALGCGIEQVLPFSTGVIMEPLPADRIIAGLPAAIADLRPDHWVSAAEAIMTTDTVPKAASRRVALSGGSVSVTGIAKGSGMIRPDMATMLGFVATDARAAPETVESLLRDAADQSFNRITVDGDTSTNDSFMLIATGAAGVPTQSTRDLELLGGAINDVASYLAQAIVRDGEGATKFVTIRIEGGRNADECRRIGYSIAHSPLVKTAFFASDPNLGRILAAIGNAPVDDLDTAKIDLYIDAVRVARGGGRDPEYREQQGIEAMKKPEFAVRVLLGRGAAAATLWTCDLSYDYVKINAEYRS